MPADTYREIVPAQREFFALLDEFFKRATGQSYTEFARVDAFPSTARQKAEHIAQQGLEVWEWAHAELASFYAKHGSLAFRQPRDLGGLKLVLGGSSRFESAHYAATRKMLLYADTILIPDPVLPWIEAARAEERFRDVLLLKAAFMLLHLKPLVDADLPYPAVVVFPSWEKSLEDQDRQTQQGILQLVADLFALCGLEAAETFDDLKRFAGEQKDEFLTFVEENRLFVAPGGKVGEAIPHALDRYRDSLQTWRTKEHLAQVSDLTDAQLALVGIMERVARQYHLFENAEALSATPMLCLANDWHYFGLCSTLFTQRLEQLGLLQPRTTTTLRAINEPPLRWLGNVPMPALVRLRLDNENEAFRRQLDEHLKQLHSAVVADVDRVAAEVSRGLASLLSEHQKEISRIQATYQKRHLRTLAAGCVTAAAVWSPALAPVLGAVAPFALIGKYAIDKVSELHEKKQVASSLMGVLAEAETGDQ